MTRRHSQCAGTVPGIERGDRGHANEGIIFDDQNPSLTCGLAHTDSKLRKPE